MLTPVTVNRFLSPPCIALTCSHSNASRNKLSAPLISSEGCSSNLKQRHRVAVLFSKTAETLETGMEGGLHGCLSNSISQLYSGARPCCCFSTRGRILKVNRDFRKDLMCALQLNFHPQVFMRAF